jgi:polar amino acid transport system substrate-binding protein
MSHEIRTPVHAITGIIHLMKEQTLTAKLQDYTNKAETASEALVHVINDVLDFSKIAAGKIELDKKPFELLYSLEKNVDLFSERFNAKHLDFVLVIDENVPRRVIGDDLRLNQILINIINNALKFTHSGTVQLRISCEQMTTDQTYLNFVIEDTGIGIDSQRLPLLFTAFSQGDASTTRKYGGTGLGLTISQKLSQLMGGNITVTSQLEKGSSFSVNVIMDVDSNLDQNIFSVLPVNSIANNVLYIGAQSKQSEMFKTLIEQFGLSLVHAVSLEQAQQKLLVGSLHSCCCLIFIDVPPPQQITIESLINKVADYSQILKYPIIYISAAKMKEDTITETQIIDRPIKPSQLFNTVISTLKLSTRPLLSLNNSDMDQAKKRLEIQNKVCGAKILVVEDVMINQQIIKEILNSGGLHVHLACNGSEALTILANNDFDLVLMDLQMPVMGGIEATSLIRQQPKLKNLPVIAITANVMKGVIDECKQIGFSDYLSKPLDVQELWEVLNVWITPVERPPFTPEMASDSYQATESIVIQQEKILGIDLTLGLNCVNGNTSLYCSLLGDFIREYESSPIRFQVFYERKDFKNLAQLAHAIKGVSSNLGLSLLAKASNDIEKQAKRVETAIDINLSSEADTFAGFSSTFSDALQQTNNSITHIVATYSVPNNADFNKQKTAQDVDHTAVKNSLNRLKQLVDNSDGDSLQIFEDLKVTLATLVNSSALAELEGHINCFDFEEASTALQDIEQQISIQSPHTKNP